MLVVERVIISYASIEIQSAMDLRKSNMLRAIQNSLY